MCLYCSVACVLYYLGEYVAAEDMYRLGQEHLRGFTDRPSLPCMSRVREFVMNSYSKRWHPRKLNINTQLLKLAVADDEFAIVTIRASDGAVNHCVTVCGTWLFDSNTATAMPFTRQSLDWCAGEGARFVCVENGYHFVKNKVSKKKNRRGRKRKHTFQSG